MVAYLLCAGFGTRMRPLTEDTPKSLLPVAGRPILDHLLDELQDWSALDAVHVAVNHSDAPAFREWAETWRASLADHDCSLSIHDDGVRSPDEQLGAVGDLRFLLEEAGPPPDGALVSGGDSLYRFPLGPLLQDFEGTRSRILALYEPNPDRRRKSTVLELDGPRLTGLVNDPTDTSSEWIGPSWYLLTPSALAAVEPYLRTGGNPDALSAYLDTVRRRERIDALRLPRQEGLRLHCNTPEDLERARTLLEDAPRYLIDAESVRESLPSRDG
ncbi:MAG: NDP-sugar synthase [Salinivenus sp.]